MTAKKTAKRLRPPRLKRLAPFVAPLVKPRLFPGEATLELSARPSLMDHLDTSTANRLRKFAQAHHGADIRVIVNKAVEDFITSDLGRYPRLVDEMYT